MDMSSDHEDLDALFEEVSAQFSSTVGGAGSAIGSSHAEAGSSVEKLPMFDSLGHIVRQLHDSLRELGYDRSLTDISSEVTDAAGRLEYIATLTEQAANKVLNSIDEAMSVQDDMAKKAGDIEARWNTLFDGKMSVEDFKVLAKDSRQFAGEIGVSAEAEKARLMTIMMAQDFQDLTGQIIKKVIGITQKLERELAQLLIDNAPLAAREKVVDLMAGPAVPASAMAQTDVDDLLADLGF
jgi:chemotaxis protein CheZ